MSFIEDSFHVQNEMQLVIIFAFFHRHLEQGWAPRIKQAGPLIANLLLELDEDYIIAAKYPGSTTHNQKDSVDKTKVIIRSAIRMVRQSKSFPAETDTDGQDDRNGSNIYSVRNAENKRDSASSVPADLISDKNE
jgi:hypothetical protein